MGGRHLWDDFIEEIIFEEMNIHLHDLAKKENKVDQTRKYQFIVQDYNIARNLEKQLDKIYSEFESRYKHSR